MMPSPNGCSFVARLLSVTLAFSQFERRPFVAYLTGLLRLYLIGGSRLNVAGNTLPANQLRQS